MGWAHEVGATLAEELGDLPDASEMTRLGVRLAVSALLGGVLGFERERSGKPAGLRTHMLVALGATLLVIIPHFAGMNDDAISRIVQGVVSGIGFLGAGAIIKSEDSGVRGMTTATTLWLSVGIGIAVGFGRLMVAVVAVLIGLGILSLFSWVERRIPRRGVGKSP